LIESLLNPTVEDGGLEVR